MERVERRRAELAAEQHHLDLELQRLSSEGALHAEAAARVQRTGSAKGSTPRVVCASPGDNPTRCARGSVAVGEGESTELPHAESHEEEVIEFSGDEEHSPSGTTAALEAAASHLVRQTRDPLPQATFP